MKHAFLIMAHNNLEIFGKDGPVTYISILAEICIVVGYHQHVEGNNEQEGYERKEPFFFLNLEYIVHPWILLFILEYVFCWNDFFILQK